MDDESGSATDDLVVIDVGDEGGDVAESVPAVVVVCGRRVVVVDRTVTATVDGVCDLAIELLVTPEAAVAAIRWDAPV